MEKVLVQPDMAAHGFDQLHGIIADDPLEDYFYVSTCSAGHGVAIDCYQVGLLSLHMEPMLAARPSCSAPLKVAMRIDSSGYRASSRMPFRQAIRLLLRRARGKLDRPVSHCRQVLSTKKHGLVAPDAGPRIGGTSIESALLRRGLLDRLRRAPGGRSRPRCVHISSWLSWRPDIVRILKKSFEIK